MIYLILVWLKIKKERNKVDTISCEGNSKETGYGLTDCILRVLKIDLDAAHKDAMRDLIINGRRF